MAEGKHLLDDVLRRFAGSPEPSLTDREYVELKLSEEIGRTIQRARRIRRRPAIVWAAGALLLVISLILAFQVTLPTPAAATMEEIATIVETVDPITASDTHYVYARSTVQSLGFVPREGLGQLAYDKDVLVYLTDSTRETWYGREGTVQVRTTYHRPTFFTDTDHDVYYAAGLDEQDQIGRTITSTDIQPIDEWPTDLDQLDRAIRDQMVTDRELPETVEYLDVAFDISGESFATPKVRATSLRLIAGLDGLELVGRAPDGAASFTVDYTDGEVETRLTFTIDRNGYVRHYQILSITADTQFGIPANTTTYQAEFTQPTSTDALD